MVTFLTLLSILSSIAVSFTSAQQITTEEVLKKICGTWANTSYSGDRIRPQKIVFRPDKSYDSYVVASQETPSERGDFSILQEWKDANGSTYCKATIKSHLSANSSFELWKLDDSGNKLESRFSFSKNTFAREMSHLPDSSGTFHYSVYYRQADKVYPLPKNGTRDGDHTQYIYATVDAKPLKAYVFQPAKVRVTNRLPAIAFFHGGGWVIGEPEWTFGLAEHFASLGMVGVAFQYRLSDQLSITPLEAMADCRAAIHWMRSNASMLGIDSDRIVAYGWSAGGHLAASTAIFNYAGANDSLSVSPNALVLTSPAVVIESDSWATRLLGARADAVSISPASHVRKGLPPTLVLQGRHDTVTPLKDAQLFCNRMRAAGNRCDLQIYEGVGHMFTPDSIRDDQDPRPDRAIQTAAIKKTEEFLTSLGFLK
jgi:acetyl esterase/lipase